jgi:2-polyprenyl-3-methyl-5-hydroxy-6-metoxy-1,4-benzoquinol methylase
VKFLNNGVSQFCYDIYKLRGHEFYKNLSIQNKKIYKENKHRIKQLKDYSCTLCCGKNGSVFLEWNGDYQLIKCNSCSAVTANIHIELNKKHIEDVYNESQYKSVKDNILATYHYRKQTFGQDRYEYCIKRLDLNESKIKVLDFGCGVGYFLSILEEHKINAIGLEVDRHQVEFCKNNNLNVTDKNIKQLNDNQFDLIVMFDVLEHLVEPVKTLKELRSKLKDNGRIIAYTPYINSFAFELMQERQNLLHPFQHVCFYSEDSLKYLAKMSRMKIEIIDHYGLDIADYFLYKEYEDGYPYVEKLEDLMCLMQGVLDKHGISNHIRITFNKEG